MKILIVDDEKMNRRLLEDVLKHKGHDVISAANGAEALKKLQAQDFGLIISDIMMPVMDGYEFCRECKQDERLKDIPFIFYTATYKDEQDKRLALELGADRFILKPTEPETFLKIVDDAIRDSKKPSTSIKKPEGEREKDTFKLYSERLVNKLEKKMLALEKEVVLRMEAEHDLKERFKELNCLYSLSQLIVNTKYSVDEVLGEAIELIPHSWQYPEITCIRIIFNGKKYKTGNFKITKWKQSSGILIKGEICGSVEVYYLEEKSKEYEGPFLKEERDLIDGIAVMLGEMANRKRITEELQESERNHRRLFELAPDSIVTVDLKGTITSCNPAAVFITGFSKDELVGKHFSKLPALKVKDIPRYLKMLSSMLKGETIEPFEVSFYRKDGAYAWGEVSTSMLKTEGKKVGIQIVTRDITRRKQAEEEHRRIAERLQMATKATVDVLAMAVEQRDPYTAGHQLRVAQLAQAIAIDMGMSGDWIEGMRLTCIIHDIGKINVPTEILSKPGRISEAEFSLIKTHAQVGYDILKNVEFPWPLAEAVLQHHERIDGSGYPKGLKGNDISLQARILAVSDVIEAMSSHRPYRPALGIGNALTEIENNKGILYDKDIVDICTKLFTEKEFKFE